MSTLTMPAMSTSPPIMMSDGQLDDATHDGIDNLVMAGGGDMKFGGSEL